MASTSLREDHSLPILHLPHCAAGLPAEWQWQRLKDVCSGVFDCPHSTPNLTGSGPFVARSQDIRSGVFRSEAAARVSEASYRERIARAEPQYGDLLYSREGTYFGIAAEVPAGARTCLGQRMVLLRPDPGQVDFRFMRHWLNSPVMQGHISGFRDGTVAERLNMPTIRALPILVPPLSQQRAIAGILGALDDKIELNRRMNETLEAMARAIFKSWFVDFDPVRAKAEGRQPPGLDPATAALFPDSFEASEIGEIPKGWTAGKLGDIANNIRRTVSPPQVPPDLSYIGLEHMPRRSLALYEHGAAGEMTSNTFGFRRGEILFGKLRPYFHKVGVAVEDGVCSTDILVLAPKEPGFFGLVLGTVTSDAFIDYADATSTGTKMPRTSWHSMTAYPIVVPPAGTAERFSGMMAPMTEMIRSSMLQSRTLSAIRDALLPKLLSGEISVAEAACSEELVL